LSSEPTKCPYRTLCQCPGDDPERGEWEPSLGFKRVPEGIFCLDWDKVITLEVMSQVKTVESEGKHLANAVEAADKIDEARRKWNRSPKRRSVQKRYENTPGGQAARKKFAVSEKFKLSAQKYYYSQKGKEAHQKRKTVIQDFRVATKWIADNPGKTFDDYLKEQKNEQTGD